MTLIKQAILELMLLTVASVAVALANNQIRERYSIDLAKDYFRKSSSTPRAQDPKAAGSPSDLPKPATSPALPAEAPATASQKPAPSAPAKKLEHDFQTISVDEARDVLEDPSTAQGLNVFVDARDDEAFADGHIPGSIQCFPYEIHRCIDRLTAAALGAEKVIVYCGGGDCEDSIFMCRELQDAGVPFEAIYLFEGGWKEWSARGLRTATGAQ